MNIKNHILAFSSTLLVTTLILLSFSFSSNAQTLYSCVSPNDGSEPFFRIIDPNTGATISAMDITLPGELLRGCNGMARHPETGVCYIMLNVDPNTSEPVPPRILATIDPQSGAATAVGNAQETFASITFDSNGTLYGVTGDGGPTPETLFTISLIDGIPTFVQTLGNGSDGEVIAFNPNDGLIYHASGSVFESINPITGIITPILNNYTEITAMVHQAGNVFLVADFSTFESITTNGVRQDIGDLDHESKGLAFDCVAPPRNIPTLSEWGLIAMVGILGLFGFMAIRRRKVIA